MYFRMLRIYKIVMPAGTAGNPLKGYLTFRLSGDMVEYQNYIKEPFMAVKDGNTVRVHYTGNLFRRGGIRLFQRA